MIGACDSSTPAPPAPSLLDSPERWKTEGTDEARVVARWTFEPNVQEPQWRRFVYLGVGTLGVVPDPMTPGNHALRFGNHAGQPVPTDGDVQVHIDVQPRCRYQLSSRIRAEELHSKAPVHGTIYIGEFDYRRDDGQDWNDPIRWHRSLPQVQGDGDEWETIGYSFETTPATRMLRIAGSLANWGTGTGAVWLDDLTLVRESSPMEGTPRLDGVQQRALTATPGQVKVFRGPIPPEAHLELDLGFEPSSPGDSADDGLIFRIRLIHSGEDLLVLDEHIDRPGWHPTSVDLSMLPTTFSRADVTWRFESATPASAHGNGSTGIGWWGEPRLVTPAGPRRPNVLLLTVDTLRPDHLGFYGSSRPTSPLLDRLARESVVFEHAYTPIPRTSPSVASLMTGLDPPIHGLQTLLDVLPDSIETLAERLSAHGYRTGAIGTRNVAAHTGLDQGFHYFSDHASLHINHPMARAPHLVDEALGWLERHGDEPFFLWLHVWDPHFRYLPIESGKFRRGTTRPLPIYRRLDQNELSLGQLYFHETLPDDQLEEAIALYDTEILETDQALGRILRHLETTGLRENTLVVFTSDHGEALGEHGYTFEHGEYLYDETLAVPLLIRWPDGRAAGQRVHGNVSLTDIRPTIEATLGLEPSTPGLDLSRSCSPPEGEPAAAHSRLLDARVLFSQTGRQFFPENPRRYLPGLAGNWEAARQGDWKLIRIPTPSGPQYELYDLANDPRELVNLYAPGHSRAQALVTALENRALSPEGQNDSPPSLSLEAQDRLRSLGYLD